MNILLIILGILKFLLIAVLIIFSITIFLLALILLVPIRYNIILKTDNLITKGTDIFANIEATWLLRSLRLNLKYKNKKHRIKLTFFGIAIIEDRKNEGRKKDDIITTMEEEHEVSKKESINNQEINYNNDKTVEYKDTKITNTEKEIKKEKEVKKETEAETNKYKKRKIKKETEINKEIEKRPKIKKERSENRFKSIFERMKYYYNYSDKKAIMESIKKLIRRLKKAIKSKKFDIYGEVGFDDPSITGQLIGIISMLKYTFGLNINLKGNFEKKIIKLELDTSGKVTLGSFVFPIIRFVFTRAIFKIIMKMILGRKEIK